MQASRGNPGPREAWTSYFQYITVDLGIFKAQSDKSRLIFLSQYSLIKSFQQYLGIKEFPQNCFDLLNMCSSLKNHMYLGRDLAYQGTSYGEKIYNSPVSQK